MYMYLNGSERLNCSSLSVSYTLFPTAIVFPSGLQQMLMFSPLVFITVTHLAAEDTHTHKRSTSVLLQKYNFNA